MSDALLLIDIQNDYFPGGLCELHRATQAAARARRALALFRAAGRPVFHIRHVSLGENAGFFLPDSKGAQIHASVAPLEGETVLVKHTPNAFRGTGLEGKLRAQGVDRLIVCGMMTHMCVDTTVRAASDLGFQVVLLGDACATKRLTWESITVPAGTVHRAMLASLNGTFATVVQTRALSPEFIR